MKTGDDISIANIGVIVLLSAGEIDGIRLMLLSNPQPYTPLISLTDLGVSNNV